MLSSSAVNIGVNIEVEQEALGLLCDNCLIESELREKNNVLLSYCIIINMSVTLGRESRASLRQI